ncbi:DUF1080 domain-containing protein, partial [Planctomycetota bacterium]
MVKSYSVLVCVLVPLFAASLLFAGPPQWETIFDGGSLDAFDVFMKGDADGTFFDVAEGVIRTYPNWEEGKDAPNGMILTKKEYGNFHLRWQYRYDGRAYRGRRNSGVLYHAQGTNVWPVCIEFQLKEDNGGWPVLMYAQARIQLTDGRYDPKGEAEEVGTMGKIVVREGATTADKPIGEWNQAEILVNGNKAYHIVNGHVIARLENLKQPNADKTDWIPLRQGRIGFQCEGAGIEFRNIEIQENPVGYIDTPVIPGQPWRVHDNARPQPPMATLAPYDPKPVPAPADAVVLLDKDTYKFTNREWTL